jgi:hypothetical protein
VRRRIQAWAFLMAPFFLSALPAAAAPQPEELVTWRLRPRDQPAGTAMLSFGCGERGVFDLAVGIPLERAGKALPACVKATECGAEVPPSYPFFGAAPEALAGAEDRRKDAADGVPCADRSCFAAVGAAGLELLHGIPAPWAAVIDWDAPHGWSVGWTLSAIASPSPAAPALPLVLLPLEDSVLGQFSSRGATDVHVLARLCQILEAIDLGGVEPPRVINMSFGRRQRSGDPRDALSCDRGTLACQIAVTLDQITVARGGDRQSPRSIAVAAAGNDRVALFPASLPSVIPAGSLQLAGFRRSGKSAPSWETPSYGSRAQALMPGYGLCLRKSAAETGWPAPPGTSYAAAVFSGWIAAVLAAEPVERPLAALPWAPRQSCLTGAGCTYRLAHGSRLYASNPRVDALMSDAFSAESCGAAVRAAGSILTFGLAPASGAELPTESFLDLFPLFKNPTPPSSPCVSCRGLTVVNGLDDPSRAQAQHPFTVDLSGASAAFPPFPAVSLAEAKLEALYVHLKGESYVQLVPSSPESFAALVDGGVRLIRIPGLEQQFARGDQPSLVFVLRPSSLELSGRPFRVSIPILVTD